MDLEVTPTEFKTILLIGSCLTGLYAEQFAARSPNTRFDYILFNNAADFPENPPLEIGAYELQFIQFPLRSVLNDSVIRVVNFNDPQFASVLIENARSSLEMLVASAMKYNVSSGILSFVSNFIVPQWRIAPSLDHDFSGLDMASIIEELNSYLAELISKYKNAFVADVNGIAGSMGKRYFLDDSIYFYTHGAPFFSDWHQHELMPPWTAPNPGRFEEIPPINSFYENRNEEFFDAVFRQLVVGYRIATQADQVKLVIFDLDNTLWRGQIAEHYHPGQASWPYLDGWPLGVWESIHHLRWRGILTSICSKNDLETVRNNWDNVFQLRWLELDDFICPKINWNPKAENIREIMAEVGLTPKSVLFIDENPVEREAVKLAFPEMRVIGSNPFLTRRILLWSAETRISYLTDESKGRETMVKNQFSRMNRIVSYLRNIIIGCMVRK
jgi:HAD superfamily phosphatase (TIGR01681 family)